MSRPFCILLVEDNADDIELTRDALQAGKVQSDLQVVKDGLAAMAFLRKEDPFGEAPSPDIILLDLNLPGKDGHLVLAEIKADKYLARIPVIVLTVSNAEEDIINSYDLHANGYIVKPVDLEQFFKVIRQLESFWMSVVKLSSRTN